MNLKHLNVSLKCVLIDKWNCRWYCVTTARSVERHHSTGRTINVHGVVHIILGFCNSTGFWIIDRFFPSTFVEGWACAEWNINKLNGNKTWPALSCANHPWRWEVAIFWSTNLKAFVSMYSLWKWSFPYMTKYKYYALQASLLKTETQINHQIICFGYIKTWLTLTGS